MSLAIAHPQEAEVLSFGRKSVAVSNLAGQSPHVRVQYETAGSWQHYASFRKTDRALACANELTQRGHRVRLVSFVIAPAAG